MKRTASKVSRVLQYSIAPAAALLAGSPVGLAIWDAPRLTLGGALLVAPFYMGLLCAPGYIYLAYTAFTVREVGRWCRWWVRASLVGALASSLGGVWGGTMVFFLLPPSLVSAIAVVLLWRAFERAPRPRASSPA